jgi:multidrug efflux pump subunit AcrB
VADIEIVWQPSEVLRRDRLRTVTVSSGLLPGYTAEEVIRSLQPWLDREAFAWGMGYRYAFGGEREKSTQANAAIMVQVPVAGFIILMLLMLQFNSFRKTFIIMTTIPLGLIGVVAGLHLTGLYFGFMTLLGIISLSGIVVNNAIVLIDRIRIEMDECGRTPQEAIVEAACRRMRPIFLSTATTALGMVPLLWGGGPIWAPMAVGIIFGLIFATALTLGVVPLLYALFFRVRYTV